MRFEVLGPLRARDTGGEIPLRGDSQRRVLGVLLSKAGEAVSLHQLIDALWPGEPPANAVKNVQSYISRLKRELNDPDRIVLRSAGYAIVLRAGDLDVQDFVNAVQAAAELRGTGDLPRAADLLERALAEAVSLSPSSCLRRTKALEAGGLIAGYRAELDRERLGLDLTVFIELKVTQHSRETSREIEAA